MVIIFKRFSNNLFYIFTIFDLLLLSFRQPICIWYIYLRQWKWFISRLMLLTVRLIQYYYTTTKVYRHKLIIVTSKILLWHLLISDKRIYHCVVLLKIVLICCLDFYIINLLPLPFWLVSYFLAAFTGFIWDYP